MHYKKTSSTPQIGAIRSVSGGGNGFEGLKTFSHMFRKALNMSHNYFHNNEVCVVSFNILMFNPLQLGFGPTI